MVYIEFMWYPNVLIKPFKSENSSEQAVSNAMVLSKSILYSIALDGYNSALYCTGSLGYYIIIKVPIYKKLYLHMILSKARGFFFSDELKSYLCRSTNVSASPTSYLHVTTSNQFSQM